MNEDKNRNWTFIVYPDSAPSNWKEILQDTGLPFAISPIHDRDIIEATGELKKPHWHVLVCFPGPTTFRKVNSLCAELNSPIPKRIMSVIGIYRYFTHADNPEKAHYNEEDIIQMNGFDIREISGMTTSQIIAIKKQLINMIKNNKIYEYSDFINLVQEESCDLFQVASTNTLFFNTFITSRRNKKDNACKYFD